MQMDRERKAFARMLVTGRHGPSWSRRRRSLPHLTALLRSQRVARALRQTGPGAAKSGVCPPNGQARRALTQTPA